MGVLPLLAPTDSAEYASTESVFASPVEITAVPIAPPPSPFRNDRRESWVPFFSSSIIANLLFGPMIEYIETAQA
jgi:hypothetical protein